MFLNICPCFIIHVLCFISIINMCFCLLMHITYLNFFPQSPPGYSRKALASKKKKTGPNMPPGGRVGKRVRAPEGLELEPPRAQLR